MLNVMADGQPQVSPQVQRIIEALDAKGSKQSWLAEKMGYSPAMVSAVLRGRFQPSLEFLFRAYRALGLPTGKIA